MSVTRGVLAALVVLGGTAGAAVAADDGATDASDVRAFRPGDALRVVAGPDGTRTLRTADGRTVRLRGANVNALVDYAGAQTTAPVTAADGAQARALGFSVMRLAVSWSRIAPSPGVYDGAYLDEVRTAARAFTDRGVRVLLDLHQDRYAAGLGPSGDESDGAPAWAAVTDGASTAKDSGGHGYYGTAASRAAAQAFFTNRIVAGKGLQEHYADALSRLAAVGEDLGPGLAGVELYNEPVDPFGTDPLATDMFSPTRLFPFYRRLVDRLRSADGTGPGAGAYDGPIWFEPQATRTTTDDDAAAARFSDDPGLVYGPHVYTDVYNGRLGPGTYARLQTSFDNAAREARAYGAALAPTELPGAQTGPWELHRAEVLRHLDRLDVGGMVWLWRQTAASSYGWGVLTPEGGIRPDSTIARDYGRARLQAASAGVASAGWDAGVLTVRTTSAGTLDLWDGAAFGATAPAVGAAPVVTVDGAAPPAGTLTGRRAAAPLSSPAEWTGGRELRLTVPEGAHEVVLRPAGVGESATPAPAPAADAAVPPTGTTTEGAPPPTTTGPTTTEPTTTEPTTAGPTTTGPAPTTDPAPTTTQPAPTTSGDAAPPSAGSTPTTGTTPAPSASATRVEAAASTPAPAGGTRPAAAVRAPASPAPSTTVERATPSVPRVTALRVRQRRFRPADGRRGGTTVDVAVSSAGRLRVVLERRTAGRRSGARCVPASGRAARGRVCVRWVPVTTETRAVRAGRQAVRITGRSAGRPVAAGAHRLVVTPSAGGVVGLPRRTSMTVLAPSR